MVADVFRNRVSTLNQKQIADAALRFKLVSDETRLRVLSLLTHGEHSVTDLRESLSVSQPGMSHHLALMRVAGVLQGERRGKNIFYSLTDLGRLLVACAITQTEAA